MAISPALGARASAETRWAAFLALNLACCCASMVSIARDADGVGDIRKKEEGQVIVICTTGAERLKGSEDDGFCWGIHLAQACFASGSA